MVTIDLQPGTGFGEWFSTVLDKRGRELFRASVLGFQAAKWAAEKYCKENKLRIKRG